MANTVTVKKGDVTEVFEDTLGHQIGNGAVQVLMMNGDQRIINNFDDISVELDDESKAKFAFDVAQAEARAAAVVDDASIDAGIVEDSVEEGAAEEDAGNNADDGSTPVKH